MDCVHVINPKSPSTLVEHPERICNDDVNAPIPDHENDDGTDPKSIQFACPEQIPPPTTCTEDGQPKRGRGRPRKPKPPNSGDKPRRGRGRPPKHKDPPSDSSTPEPKKHKVDHSANY